MHRCGAGIFKALSPHYLFLFFIRNGFSGWVALGGTLLCVTGSEALYADLGHFSKTAIRVSGILPACRVVSSSNTTCNALQYDRARLESCPHASVTCA